MRPQKELVKHALPTTTQQGPGSLEASQVWPDRITGVMGKGPR